MNSLHDIEQMAKIRQQELLQEATQWRESHPQTPTNERFYAPIMAKVGEVLTDVGTQLQERYGESYGKALETGTFPQTESPRLV